MQFLTFGPHSIWRHLMASNNHAVIQLHTLSLLGGIRCGGSRLQTKSDVYVRRYQTTIISSRQICSAAKTSMARCSVEVTKFNYPLLLLVNDARDYLELSETESASHQSQALLYLSEQRALDIVLANVFISMGNF